MTCQDVIDRVWRMLNDDGTRWPSATLVSYVNDAESEIFRMAPWLYVVDGNTIDDPATIDATGDTLALNTPYLRAYAAFVCALALQEDGNEAANRERASVYMTEFYTAMGLPVPGAKR